MCINIININNVILILVIMIIMCNVYINSNIIIIKWQY